MSTARVEARGSDGPSILEPDMKQAPMNADKSPGPLPNNFRDVRYNNKQKNGAKNTGINDGK